MHKMSKPVFWKKNEKNLNFFLVYVRRKGPVFHMWATKNLINLSSVFTVKYANIP